MIKRIFINLLKKFFKKKEKERILVLNREELLKYLEEVEGETKQFLQQIKAKGKKRMDKIFKTWADPTKTWEYAEKSIIAIEEETDPLKKLILEEEKLNSENYYETMQKIQKTIARVSKGEKLTLEEATEAQIILRNLTAAALKQAKEDIPEASYCTYKEIHNPICPKVSFAVTAGIAVKNHENKTSYFQIFDKKDVHIGDAFLGNDEISVVSREEVLGIKKN